eukprot:TRINITY_DN6052_c1_g1_i1.p1 TRINITY_DN6052_c1_g1~~TRINITY_DN6052_c1_g1_i1.p1  ORF type:complete len:371 (-),score=50.68 TRINITY_DN6052_c1_g1_i1:69-1181(-)
MAASAARALLQLQPSRINDLDLFRLSFRTPPRHLHPTSTSTSTSTSTKQRKRPLILSCCLVSGVDGGGVADEFVSTRKSGFGHEFSVLANMLKQIEPLDTSLVSKGVSAPAKDSMKRTISTMLGLLPSDQFSVTIRVSRQPLDRLLFSSIITGYTLWNAEYRVSLMRNFDSSPGNMEKPASSLGYEVKGNECEEREFGDEVDGGEHGEDVERRIPQSLGDLSPAALNYIQELKSELATIEKELNAQKLENIRMECNKEANNDLLEYLRSLEPGMVTELSRPSSPEVEEIIQQLVQNILQKLFKDDTPSDFLEDSVIGKTLKYPVDDVEHCDAIGTSRDYLAKLLFWCMLLGHHMRGLECRLHLSCVVGLL